MEQIIKYKCCILLLIFINAVSSCKKTVEVDPPIDRPDTRVVYSSDALATAVLTGLFSQMSTGSFATGYNSISVKSGLSADELTGYASANSEAFAYYQNNVDPTYYSFWTELYQYVYTANSAIEGITNSTKLSEPVKKQLLGEAKFMRGFLYFYLVNLFGDVPLNLTTDFKKNSQGNRAPQSEVYKQIVKDLIDAQQLMNDKYVSLNLVTTTSERVRPNKGAASAMLSRVYLYTKEYANAEVQATSVISNTQLYDTVSLNKVFLKNSKEAIWQLQPVVNGLNTQDGFSFILFGDPSFQQPATISPQLYNSFSNGDQRKINWISNATFGSTNYYFPFKYKVFDGTSLTEYLMVLRLAEQYLIRAEARAQLNKISEALQDVNVIRKRAGLPDTTASNQQTLLGIIEHERQVELFTEWGHRWLDLKRTQRVDAVMSIVAPQKGGAIWQSYKQLYPIPLGDIQVSNSLMQNAGY